MTFLINSFNQIFRSFTFSLLFHFSDYSIFQLNGVVELFESFIPAKPQMLVYEEGTKLLTIGYCEGRLGNQVTL